MAKEIKIGNKKIGDGHPCFIIAEAGSNYNKRFDLAKKLIDIAAEAGADAVKFQLFRAKKTYVLNAGQSDYLRKSAPIYEIIKSMEMPYSWLPKLARYCQKRGIIFLSAVNDEKSARKLDPYVVAYKIGSFELNHYPLISYVASLKKPMILSTGISTIEEIKYTINNLRRKKNHKICLMHCISAYPAPIDSLNLRVIPKLKSVFKVPVGFSDHTPDPLLAPLGAISLGANLIEKHFTLSKKMTGPDHRFALEPEELETMIKTIRELESALGDGRKKVEAAEKELFYFAKRGIQTIENIKKGERFSKENIGILRPGKQVRGVSPKYWSIILGRKSKCNLKKGQGVPKRCF